MSETFDDQTPWLNRDWRMIRQYRLDYPSKRVDEADGEHYHFEDDTSQMPHKVELFPIFLEKDGDKYVRWSYSLYGPVGTSGTLTPQAEAKLEQVTRRKDRRSLEQFIKTLEHADRTGQVIAESMLTAKHGKPIDLSKDNGQNKA